MPTTEKHVLPACAMLVGELVFPCRDCGAVLYLAYPDVTPIEEAAYDTEQMDYRCADCQTAYERGLAETVRQTLESL